MASAMLGSGSAVHRGVPVLLPVAELERLFAAVQQQVEQLSRERSQLRQTVQKLEALLEGQRESVKQLQVERERYKLLAQALIQAANPLNQAVEDLKNYPPPEQCHSAEEVLADLEALHRSLQQRG